MGVGVQTEKMEAEDTKAPRACLRVYKAHSDREVRPGGFRVTPEEDANPNPTLTHIRAEAGAPASYTLSLPPPQLHKMMDYLSPHQPARATSHLGHVHSCPGRSCGEEKPIDKKCPKACVTAPGGPTTLTRAGRRATAAPDPAAPGPPPPQPRARAPLHSVPGARRGARRQRGVAGLERPRTPVTDRLPPGPCGHAGKTPEGQEPPGRALARGRRGAHLVDIFRESVHLLRARQRHGAGPDAPRTGAGAQEAAAGHNRYGKEVHRA